MNGLPICKVKEIKIVAFYLIVGCPFILIKVLFENRLEQFYNFLK